MSPVLCLRRRSLPVATTGGCCCAAAAERPDRQQDRTRAGAEAAAAASGTRGSSSTCDRQADEYEWFQSLPSTPYTVGASAVVAGGGDKVRLTVKAQLPKCNAPRTCAHAH
jgi:hypothetical protein